MYTFHDEKNTSQAALTYLALRSSSHFSGQWAASSIVHQHVLQACDIITVTVTEALVLRPLLENRGRITESVRILVPVDRIKQKCFQITTKQVR